MSPWARAARLASAVLGMLVLLSSGNPVPADDAAERFVVPPGQEKLLGEMLGLGATLPEQCRFTGGDADGAVIHATYACGGSEVAFELHHPSAAPAGAPRTEQFALVVRSGTPPPGLSDAVLSLVRAREAEFHWLAIQLPAQPARIRRVWLAIAGLVALAALGWAVRRKRSARRTPP